MSNFRYGVGRVLMMAVAGVLLVVSLLSIGCGSSKTPKAKSATEALALRPLPDVIAPLRGTIGSEVEIGGIQPTIVSGYGFVVGLAGTGGLELDQRVEATMEREMAAMGIGRDNPLAADSEGQSPRQLLRNPDTAVVLVQAAIAPGTPDDSSFDVYVKALNATSLEGGKLWTTRLRLGSAQPLGGVQARLIGEAKGPIFINPFSESTRTDMAVTKTVGRVLDGGAITSPLGISLSLYNESHARARSITSAINNRFPNDRGDRGAIAKGRTSSIVEVAVPQRYRDEPGAFILLVKHLRIDSSAPEESARRYTDGLLNEPQYADEIAWCLEAIGHKSLPFVRGLYNTPDLQPRLAALRVGARLNDATAAGPLKELALNGPAPVRADAIALLGKLQSGPTVDKALRELLGEKELSIRIAAYEALAKRAERAMAVRIRQAQPTRMSVSPTMIEELAKARLPVGMMQGIERIPIVGSGFKFFLDIVPEGDPLIYVTQQGTPRVVLFGADQALRRPSTVSLWQNAFLMQNDGGDSDLRMMYRPTPVSAARQQSCRPQLPEVVATLASRGTGDDPDGGLDMSYSDVVAVLNAMAMGGATPAGFATETDRLKASLLNASEAIAVRERPETPAERELVVFREPEATQPTEKEQSTPPPVDKPSIVPIKPLKDPK